MRSSVPSSNMGPTIDRDSSQTALRISSHGPERDVDGGLHRDPLDEPLSVAP